MEELDTKRPEGDQREPLSRTRILACALAMIDRYGLEGLSMRRLAAELDVSAMSLYNHVPNKDALLEGVTEALLGEIDLSAVAREEWDEALRAGFRSFRTALLSHPNALPLIQTKPIVTPEAFRPVELSLATLRRAGFESNTALEAHWVLVGFTIGHVSFQLTNPLNDPLTSESEMFLRRQQLPAEEFPNLFECLPHAIGCDFDAAYAFGLDTIIEGLRVRLATT